jgi:hypothetical protein
MVEMATDAGIRHGFESTTLIWRATALRRSCRGRSGLP